MNKIFGKIATKKEYFSLLQEANSLQKKLEQLDREGEEVVRSLGVDVEMVYKDSSQSYKEV